MNKLALVIPGLLGPLPELEQRSDVAPQCIILQKWLACADLHTTESTDYYSLLAELFGLNRNYSVTKLSALIDGFECSNAHCFRADPVHFKTDIDHAILLDYTSLSIRDYEAQALADAFNQHFSEDGLKLHVGHKHRWYLSFTHSIDLQTTPLKDAIGRNVQHFLPRGADALNWKRFLNEAQMLFHSHEVNREREAKGQMTINSLWLWGEGHELEPARHKHWQWLMSDDVMVNGLGLWSGVKRFGVDMDFDPQQLPEGDGIIVLDHLLVPVSYGDVDAWAETVELLCKQWLEKLHKALNSKKIRDIELYTADGRMFKLKTSCFFRFWRQKKPVTDYVSQS